MMGIRESNRSVKLYVYSLLCHKNRHNSKKDLLDKIFKKHKVQTELSEKGLLETIDGQLHYSVSYCHNRVYISVCEFKHAIDVENKTLSSKHENKLVSKSDRLLLERVNGDTRIVWCLKECIIKLLNQQLFSLIENSINIQYAIYTDKECKIDVNKQILYGYYGTINNGYYAILTRKSNPLHIEFIDFEHNDKIKP